MSPVVPLRGRLQTIKSSEAISECSEVSHDQGPEVNLAYWLMGEQPAFIFQNSIVDARLLR